MADLEHRPFSQLGWLWNNVKARPLRTALTVVAIAIQVFLVMFTGGITSGLVADWAKRVEGVGADLLVQPPSSSIFFALSSAVMQESIGEKISQIKGVDEAAPVLVVVDTRTMDAIYGINYARFSALSKGFLFLQGRPFQAPDEALIDDVKAHSKKLKLGDKVNLMGHEFTVSGIVAHGKGARFFIPLETAQDIVGAENRVTMFYVRSTGDTERTRQEIVRQLPEYRVRAMDEYLTLMNSANLPELKAFVRSIISVGVAVGFLATLLTMYTVVLERSREIGILKALGASHGDIILLIVGETLLLAALGILVGLGSAYGVRAILREAIPSLTILLSQDWVLRSAGLAFAAALCGALYPAYRATQFDPVAALAYE